MIGVAIVGAGIGREHLWAYRKLPDLFDVKVIVDRDLERAASIADGLPCAATLDDALARGDIDLVDVCLPPDLHVPTATQALQAGCDVICEKPLAPCLADVDRLLNVASTTGRSLFPVFQYRWGPGLAQLRALITAGLTGKPQVASVETHWMRDAAYYDNPWRGTWAGEHGGAIVTHAIHNHDLISHLFGTISAVSAATTTRVNDIETEDCAALILECENGALCTSSVTLGAATDETRLRLVFENLTATSGTEPYAPGQGDWSFTARDPANQRQIDTIVADTRPEPSGFDGFLTHVGRQLTGLPANAVTLADGRASIELAAAVYTAARSGQRVTLPLGPDNPLYEGVAP